MRRSKLRWPRPHGKVLNKLPEGNKIKGREGVGETSRDNNVGKARISRGEPHKICKGGKGREFMFLIPCMRRRPYGMQGMNSPGEKTKNMFPGAAAIQGGT